MRSARRGLAAAAVVLVLAAGCGGDDDEAADSTDSAEVTIGGTAEFGGPVAWPAPPADQVAELTGEAGLALEPHESLIHHVHAHLDVFIDGEHRTVPAAIGIVIADPAVHVGRTNGEAAYGGIELCEQPCISPLHTHDVTGVIHTESATEEDNTLGQFFQEWDVRLDDQCIGDYCKPDTPIAIYVDGELVDQADAADIRLTQQLEIAIVIGDPPPRIPASGDFSQA